MLIYLQFYIFVNPQSTKGFYFTSHETVSQTNQKRIPQRVNYMQFERCNSSINQIGTTFPSSISS